MLNRCTLNRTVGSNPTSSEEIKINKWNDTFIQQYISIDRIDVLQMRTAIEQHDMKSLNILKYCNHIFHYPIDDNGGTALLYAILHENHEAIELIVKINPNINESTKLGTALKYALKINTSDKIIQLLLKLGAYLDDNLSVTRYRYIENAKLNHIKIHNEFCNLTDWQLIYKIIKNPKINININTLNYLGGTLLHKTVYADNPNYKLIYFLLKNKIDCNIRDFSNSSAISIANNINVVKILLPYTALNILNLPNFHKRTMLMEASLKNNFALVKLLIENNVDIHYKDINIQMTALDWNIKYYGSYTNIAILFKNLGVLQNLIFYSVDDIDLTNNINNIKTEKNRI